MRAEAELDAAVGHQRLDAGQQRIDVQLAEAVGMESLEEDRRRCAAARQQARDHLLLQHAVKLARHARGEEEPCLADIEREAAGGADRVVDDLRAGGQHGLLAVVRRHDAAALGEEVLHLRQPLFVQHEVHAGRLGGYLLRQVIDGGAEAAVDDDRIDALGGKAERLQQAFPVVADGGAPVAPRARHPRASGSCS